MTGMAVKTIRMDKGLAATLPRPVICRRRFVRWSLIEVEVWISDIKRRATNEKAKSNVIPLSSATRARQREQVLLTLTAHQASMPADSLAADSPAKKTDSYSQRQA